MLEKDYVILVMLSGIILKIKEGELSCFLVGDSLYLGIITYRVFHYRHNLDELIEWVNSREIFDKIIIRSIREASIALLKNCSLD